MDRRDAMSRMREELNEINPAHLVRTTGAGLNRVRSPSLGEVAAAASPVRRALPSEARRNLYLLAVFSLLLAALHHWIVGAVASGQDGWQDWAHGFLTFPFAWAQPIIATLGGVGLLGLAAVSEGFKSMTARQAKMAIPLAWAAAIGSGALAIFGVIYIAAILVLAILALAFLAFLFYILIGMASG